MQLKLGDKIKELRTKEGRTQEALASALGVTGQAVSRWESGGSYPDIELIPSIANFFGISIDELFGYSSDRERKIDEIIAKIDSFGIKARGDDEWVDECLSILRAGLAEFPQNERLMITLADTLSEAGWRRHNEWLYYDEEGYMRHDYDTHRKNEHWTESVKICETLVGTAADHEIVNRAIGILVLLCRNFGENEKAVSFAKRMPRMNRCRELLLCAAADGKEEAKYVGEALLLMAREFAEQLVYGLIVNKRHYESDMPIDKIKGAIAIFDLLCDDGNYGDSGGILIQLYLYLSRVEWERGYHDDAFISLDNALEHARALESILDGEEHFYTAPLLKFVKTKAGSPAEIAKTLPDDWPWWCNPDYSQVAKEIKADPRWGEWVGKTQE
jgi:transcriptional regulator with XRE-family HTH domain